MRAHSDLLLSTVSFPPIISKYSISLVPEHIYQQVYLPENVQTVVLIQSSGVPFQMTKASILTAVQSDTHNLEAGHIHYSIKLDDPKVYPIVAYEYVLVPKAHSNHQKLLQLSTLVDNLFTLRQKSVEKLGYQLLTPELQSWVQRQLTELVAMPPSI